MTFFTDLYDFILIIWASYSPFELMLMVLAMWMAIFTVWNAIETMWMAITTMWMTITSMWMMKTTSYDPLDLVFKIWLSIILFVIFRMGTKYFRELELQHMRSQEDIRNMQTGFNEDMKRVADCFKHQIEIEHERYHKLLSMMQDMKGAQVPSERITKLKDCLRRLQINKESAVEELTNLADNLDEHFSKIQKAKIAGSAVSIGGGIIIIVGLALIPFSFGTSAILSITGGAISGAGGMTAGGSSIVDAVLSSKRSKSAKNILDDYNSIINELKVECLEIGQVLSKNSSNMETEFKPWCNFWNKMVHGLSSAKTSWNSIVNPILNSLKLASFGEDIATAGLRGASVAGRAFTLIGGGIGLILMPIDIYVLVDSAIDVHKNNPHNVSMQIRNIADKIKKECPSDQEIDNMIEATFNRRTISDREVYQTIH